MPGAEPDPAPGAVEAGPRTGTVSAFDDDRGLGTVRQDDGTTYPFHCTALTDGSRRVAVGTKVAFVVAAGHLGRVEARRLRTSG